MENVKTLLIPAKKEGDSKRTVRIMTDSIATYEGHRMKYNIGGHKRKYAIVFTLISGEKHSFEVETKQKFDSILASLDNLFKAKNILDI